MPIAKEKGTDFVPAPDGTHVARCIWVISLGTQPSNNPKFAPAFKILLGWELPEEVIEYNGEQRPMVITKEYTLSLNEKANLRKDLESWRAKAFTPEERAGFEVAKVVGVPCLLTVTHQDTSNGRTYAKVSAVSALAKGQSCKAQVHPSVLYELQDGNSDTFRTLPEWIQKKISQAEEITNPPATHSMSEPNDGFPVEDDVPF